MPASLHSRRLEPELMDEPGLDPSQHAAALRGLRRINWFSRSDAILWRPVLALVSGQSPDRPLRVLDIATGGGDVLLRLVRRARNARLPLEFSACDNSATALALARASAAKAGLEPHFFQCDVVRDGVPEGYDVITCSLFLHHLDTALACQFLRQAGEVAARAVLVNDLLRTQTGAFLAAFAPRILTRSRIVHVDARLSVRAAFSESEAEALAEEAGLRGARITRHWPERFLLDWRRDE